MDFKLEIDLVDAFREQLDLFLPTETSVGLCKTEKAIKWKWHTDLMLADFDGQLSLSDRKNLPKITRWLQTQLARTKTPKSPDELCKGFVPRTEERRRKQLRSLVRWGFMDEDDMGRLQVTKHLDSIAPQKTIGFEAKLSDWKRAVEQATNYRRFAHSAWVIMPERFAKHDALIAACRTNQIGLAVLHANDVSKIVNAVVANDSIPRRGMRYEMLVDFARYGATERWFFVQK